MAKLTPREKNIGLLFELYVRTPTKLISSPHTLEGNQTSAVVRSRRRAAALPLQGWEILAQAIHVTLWVKLKLYCKFITWMLKNRDFHF
jgi:hypothetical protein